jgi:hypothetical protein
MKVRTNLQAGNLIDDLNREATAVTDVARGWYDEASRRINSIGEWTETQVARVDDLRNRLLSF